MKNICVLMVITCCLLACKQQPKSIDPNQQQQPLPKINKVTNLNLTSYKPNEVLDETTTFTEQDVQTLAEVIKALGRIIARQSSFEIEKPIIGEVKLTVTKFAMPTRWAAAGGGGYIEKISGKKSISFGFERVDESSPWSKADLRVYYTGATPKMVVSSKFFDYLGLKLEKAVHESIEGSGLGEQNTFNYRSKDNKQHVQYIFEAESSVSDIKDGYPKSFIYVNIIHSDPS
jgi:hypothetical protein